MSGQRTYPSLVIANYLLRKAWSEGINDVSPLKLQKLIYYCHGWVLAATEHPLISDRIEAWDWGPVIPTLYHEFKTFGNRPIKDLATDAKGFPYEERIDSDVRQVVDQVWDSHKNRTASDLSLATHAPGTPWAKAMERHGSQIPDKWIEEYFYDLALKRAEIQQSAERDGAPEAAG